MGASRRSGRWDITEGFLEEVTSWPSPETQRGTGVWTCGGRWGTRSKEKVCHSRNWKCSLWLKYGSGVGRIWLWLHLTSHHKAFWNHFKEYELYLREGLTWSASHCRKILLLPLLCFLNIHTICIVECIEVDWIFQVGKFGNSSVNSSGRFINLKLDTWQPPTMNLKVASDSFVQKNYWFVPLSGDIMDILIFLQDLLLNGIRKGVTLHCLDELCLLIVSGRNHTQSSLGRTWEFIGSSVGGAGVTGNRDLIHFPACWLYISSSIILEEGDSTVGFSDVLD